MIKSSDNVGCTFVNTVVGRGILNGVINLSFATFNFTPTDTGEVDVDPVVTCRLRMDKVCATQLRDVMNSLLADIEKAELAAVGGTPPVEQAEGLMPKRAKPN